MILRFPTFKIGKNEILIKGHIVIESERVVWISKCRISETVALWISQIAKKQFSSTRGLLRFVLYSYDDYIFEFSTDYMRDKVVCLLECFSFKDNAYQTTRHSWCCPKGETLCNVDVWTQETFN